MIKFRVTTVTRKTSSEVRKNVQKSIQQLINEGIKPSVISEDGYAHWWFGKFDICFIVKIVCEISRIWFRV